MSKQDPEEVKKAAEEAKQFNLPAEVETIIWGGLALLLAFLTWAPASLTGSLGQGVHCLSYGIFGQAALFLPLFFFYLAGESHLQKPKEVSWRRKLYLAAFVLCILVLITLIFIDPQGIYNASRYEGRYSAWQAVRYSYISAWDPTAALADSAWKGGVIGNIVALSLIRLIGKSGGIILLIVMLLALAVVIFDLSWRQTLLRTAEGVSATGKRITAWGKEFTEKRKHMMEHNQEQQAKLSAEQDLNSSQQQEGRGVRPAPPPKPQSFSFEFPEGNWLKDDFDNKPQFIYRPPVVRQPDLNAKMPEDAVSPLVEKETATPAIRSAFVPLKEEYLLQKLVHVSPAEPLRQRAVDEKKAEELLHPQHTENTLQDAERAQQSEERVDTDTEVEKLKDIASRISEGEDELYDRSDRADWEDRSTERKKSKVKGKIPAGQMNIFAKYFNPPTNLLVADEHKGEAEDKEEVRLLGAKLETTLQDFGVDAEVVNFITGPTISRFEVKPGPGVKVSKIVNLSDDIALALAASSVRIEAPIPGKSAVGIEIPNKHTRAVRLRDIIESPDFQNHSKGVTAGLGRNIQGDPILCDLSAMPHMLIAGATGSGKSVCINSIIISLLYRFSPRDLRIVMIDPKVVELSVYNGIPHLESPVVTNPKKAYGVLEWAVKEMERRYQLFAENQVRDFKAYNKIVEQGSIEDGEHLPYILLIIDELSDLMATTPTEVEDAIARLTSMARAAGIHLIIATQRPSVDVITGVIKANIPSRISFAVASQVDSRTILDMGGAEKLLGKGDMLYYPQNAAKPLRGQGAFVTDAEVERVVAYLKSHYPSRYNEELKEELENVGKPQSSAANGTDSEEEDELLYEALRTVVESDYASVSLLQRRLNVGYPRAARMVDTMHERGWVGPFEGSKPRKLTISTQEAEEIIEENT